MIEAKRVSKNFGDKTVLSEISFCIKEGGVFGVMGRNGAGKTTLIKAILRELPYSGQIIVSDQLLIKNRLSPEECYFVSDTPHTYEYLSGLEFIQFSLRIKKKQVPNQERIFEVLDSFGIEKSDSLKLIKDYSFGMKRKIVLTVGFLMKPKLMILDEPTIGLDVPSVITLKKLILAASKRGMTFLVTSHDPAIMAELCDSLLILHDSRAVYYNEAFQSEKENLSTLYIKLIGDKIDKKIESILEF